MNRPATSPYLGFLLLLLVVTLSPSTAASGTERALRLTASDGYPLAAVVHAPNGPPTAGVVLLHMYRHDKENWAPLVPHLVSRGFAAIAIDLRGHGDSRMGADGSDNQPRVLGRDPVLFNEMHLDAAAAVRWLQKKYDLPPGKIALIGASVGCSVALQFAAQGTFIPAAVVLMTPGLDYLGIPTDKHLKSWPDRPLLVLSSEEEADKGARTIARTLATRGASLSLIQQEDIHGTNMFGEVDGIEETIVTWLAKHFL